MPGSAISASSSSASSVTRRAKARQYRTVSTHSNVDESLFGQPIHITKRNQMLEDLKNIEGCKDGASLELLAKQRVDKRKKSMNKDVVQVITKDLIRNLIVPDDDPSGHTMILTRPEFDRIVHKARILSKEEKQDQQDERNRQKDAAVEACQERKKYMKEMDLARRKNEKLNEFEEEAKEKAENLLLRASELRQEQEDEIKHLNELILNAKCHAIRDAQILEKGQVAVEMTEEEKRLDIMMEVDRQNAIHMQDEIDRKRKEEKLIGAAKLMEQIQVNEQERLFDLERKDQENVQMKKYISKLMDEEYDNKMKKMDAQRDLRLELNLANDSLLKRREFKLLQEKVEEAKVLEFQKKKAEREAAFEVEQEKIRIEKEKETARLRALQERAKDAQSERDELRARRAMEQAERDWRKKEAQEALKKADMADMLINARSHQMSQKEHYMAVQAQRERVEFERVLRAQKELVEKERREEEVVKAKRLVHADEVRKQIRLKEQEKIHERSRYFEEGVKLDMEARERRDKLEKVKRKKLQSLRDAGIPEKYLSQVERKVNQTAKITV